MSLASYRCSTAQVNSSKPTRRSPGPGAPCREVSEGAWFGMNRNGFPANDLLGQVIESSLGDRCDVIVSEAEAKARFGEDRADQMQSGDRGRQAPLGRRA